MSPECRGKAEPRASQVPTSLHREETLPQKTKPNHTPEDREADVWPSPPAESKAVPQILGCFLAGLPILHTEARRRPCHLCALLQALLDLHCQIIMESQLYVNKGEHMRHGAASAPHPGHYSQHQVVNMHTEGDTYLYLYTQVSLRTFEVTKISSGGLRSRLAVGAAPVTPAPGDRRPSFACGRHLHHSRAHSFPPQTHAYTYNLNINLKSILKTLLGS